MKIGYCFMGRQLVEMPQLVRLVAELGYDGIEISSRAFDAIGLDGVRETIAGLPIEVAQVNPWFDFTSSDESLAESINLADQYVEYARALGCTRIRTFASKMRAFESGDDAEPIHWKRAVTGIQALCDMAAPYGISAVLEVHYGDGQLFDTSSNTLRILEAVNRANCSVNLQPPLRGEDPLESAERLGPHVTHLHAHNWKGAWGNFTSLEEGDVDFEQFIRILHGHGFDGYISLEHTQRDPEGIARREIVYLRRLINKIQAV